MSKELFQQILSELKKCQPTDKPYAILAFVTSKVHKWPDMCEACTCADLIKVMESGIFHKGGIKGVPDKKGGYTSWRLNDLALFILRVNRILVDKELNEIMTEGWEIEHRKRKTDDISTIDNIIKEINYLGLNCPIGRRNFNKLVKASKYLHDIKSNLLFKSIPPCPKALRNEKDRIDELIDLFQKQVHPKTPETTISEAISKLLWEITKTTVEPSAIRQRMARAKRRDN